MLIMTDKDRIEAGHLLDEIDGILSRESMMNRIDKTDFDSDFTMSQNDVIEILKKLHRVHYLLPTKSEN